VKKLSLIILIFFFTLNLAHRQLKKSFSVFEVEYGEEEEEEEEEKKRPDQPDKFLLFHRGIRTGAGESAPGYTANYKWTEIDLARKHAARRRISGGRAHSNGVLEWKERGPGNVPGRTRALYNIPGDPNNNTWLAGAATGGIWRTTDGGATWTEKSIDFPALPISCFGADSAATVIYAGTGEYVSSIYSAIGNGIFKSTDKGQSWTQLPATHNSPDFSIVTRLVVHPTNSNIIVATTVPHNLTQDNTSAIMRSTNGGASWTKVKEVTGFFEQIIATPGNNNFNILYASQNSVGVWKSIDGGETWTLSNEGMTSNGRMEIAVSPVNKNRLFASTEGSLSGTDSDLYHSTDGGTTWSLIDVRFNNSIVDFFEGQGFYDNTIMCDPFNENIVYFGGVSLFRSAVNSPNGTIANYDFEEINTNSFLLLQSFTDTEFANERLTTGTPKPGFDVEIRFGPGLSQLAHRFLVPENRTSGVQANQYTYTNYVSVPFQVWDVTGNRQLMVSFRDQNRNGNFDLLSSYLTSDGSDALLNSREYIYVHNLSYNTAPHASVDQAGGQEVSMAYTFFPALASGALWNPSALPASTLKINHFNLTKFNATTVTVADGRGSFDNKNKSDQVNLHQGMHPDHHFMIPAIVNQGTKTYKIILGNDGGVFVSKIASTPGITEGDWLFKGFGYNTSQFYGADKKPGADEYIGGTQDNGTRISPKGETANSLSNYLFGIGGDGFEVIWNSKDPDKIMGSVYNGAISRTLNGGITWQSATAGMTPGNNFPFVTKLANSKDFPERVFTVGSDGVYVSENFGGSWKLTPIASQFVIGAPTFLDIEVSRANANIVWAGSGMNNTGALRNLHVSTNGGKSFTVTNNFTEAPLGNITKLSSHPTQSNTAYALFSFANRPKILRTTNLGQSWEDISGFGAGSSSTRGFPDVAVYCLYVRPDDPDILWAGTEIGIVESQDNGQSWTLLNDFLNVSVWDMKGQDNQVVIATHGRGIWTAILAQSQSILVPEIQAAGTTPQGKLAVRIQTPAAFDSVHVYAGTLLIHHLYALQSGVTDIEMSSIIAGEKKLSLISFKGGAPFQSSVYAMKHMDILSAKDSYANYLNTTEGLILDGLTLGNLPGQTTQNLTNLMTAHPYSANKTHEVFIRTPVTVSSTDPTFYYSDIAITEPVKDQVSVEATKNGLDWIALQPSYDAAFSGDTDGAWIAAYTNEQAGTVGMLLKHEVDISESFSAGELLLFRMRMTSGPAKTAWGWAISYISIQEVPLSTELAGVTIPLTLYPNPTRNALTIAYTLSRSSEVTLSIVNIFGQTLRSKNLGMKNAGSHTEPVELGGSSTGTYMIILLTSEGRKVGKVVLER
jgi:hypothetical protein